MDFELYKPELDYAANGYKPFLGRKEHFCVSCINYYKKLYEEGITKQEFPFLYKEKGKTISSCKYDYKLVTKKITRNLFDSDEDYDEALRVADPVTWAYTELGWEPRWYQEEILGCSNQFKAIRAGRRVGKTASIAVLILWYSMTNSNFKTLVVCPYIAQVTKIFENIKELISRSPDISNSIANMTKNPNVISFNNGSIIKGFAMGGASGGKSDQVRGQDADLIAIDEADFIADEDLEVVMAILTSNKLTKVIASSTPRGLRSRLYKWTHQKDDFWKEFWYISSEGPSWDEKIENFYKSMYSEGGFAREFLAEFGSEAAGVFKPKDLQKALQDYTYEECEYNPQCRYTIGVDWNKITGTHICVIESPKNYGETGKFYYKLVDKKIIRRSEHTQLSAIRAILELDKKWKAEYVYCDAGYGHTQIEIIHSEDLRSPANTYKKRVKAIDMGSNTIMYDPISKQEISKPVKPFMVYTVAAQVERGFVVLPRDEDTTAQIIPEEIEFANIGVVQQARNFKVEKVSQAGRETFSQDYEHTLTAWMLAIYAQLMEFGDYQKREYDSTIAQTGPIGVPKELIDKIKLNNAELEKPNRRISIDRYVNPEGDPIGSPGENVIFPGTSTPPVDNTGSGYRMGIALTNISGDGAKKKSDLKWKRVISQHSGGSRVGKLKRRYGR